jgi:hypothetical protein
VPLVGVSGPRKATDSASPCQSWRKLMVRFLVLRGANQRRQVHHGTTNEGPAGSCLIAAVTSRQHPPSVVSGQTLRVGEGAGV